MVMCSVKFNNAMVKIIMVSYPRRPFQRHTSKDLPS